MGAPDFFQIKDLDIQSNYCKNIFYSATIKNDNGAIAMRNFCATRMEPTTPPTTKRKTYKNRRLAGLCPYVFYYYFDE